MKTLQVSIKDLFSEVVSGMGHGSTTVVTVARGSQKKEDYSVPIDGKGSHAAAAKSEEGSALH